MTAVAAKAKAKVQMALAGSPKRAAPDDIEDIERAMLEEATENDALEIANLVQAIEAMQPINAVDVSEVYSPPRFTKEAAGLGLSPGTAFDLETGWNLADTNQFIEARATAEEERPKLLTGSPPCEAFSK